jgi:murein DD-endopeptidase MepM/ murein hydrolase activator NlpD
MARTSRTKDGISKRLLGTPIYAVAEGEIVAVIPTDDGDYGKTITFAFLSNGKWYFAF